MPYVLIFAIYVLKNWKLSAAPPKWLRDPLGGRDPQVGNRWARVSACEGLTNQLLSCWVDPRIAWKNTDTAIVFHRWTGGVGTPRPVLLTGAKKSHLGCLISFQLPMGFQNFVIINKIHPLKKSVDLFYMPLLKIICLTPSNNRRQEADKHQVSVIVEALCIRKCLGRLIIY